MIDHDLIELFRRQGVRANIVAGNTNGALYTLVERVSYTGTSAALVAPSADVSDNRWQVRHIIPIYGVAVACGASFEVNEVIRPGGALAVTLVGGGNYHIDVWQVNREVVEQWCAKNNRPIP